MDPLIGAGLIAVGGSLLSSMFNRSSNEAAAKLSFAQQKELQRLQYMQNEMLQNHAANYNMVAQNKQMNWQAAQAQKFFDLENEYNSPINQMKRLQEAGINPFVAASQYGTGMSQQGQINVPNPSSTSPMPSASVGLGSASVQPPAPIDLSSGFSTLAQGLAAMAEAKKAGIETKQLDALFEDTAKQLRLRNQSQELQNAYDEVRNSIYKVYGFRNARAGYRKTLNEISELASRAALENKQVDVFEAERLLKEAERDLKGEELAAFKEQRPVILANLKKQGAVLDSQKKANEASANASNEQAGFYKAQKRKTVSEAEYQESMNKVTTKANDIRGTVQEILRYVHKNPKMSSVNKDVLYKMADGLLEEIQALTPEYYKVHEEGSYTSEHMKLLQQQIKRAIKENDWFEVERLTNILTGIAGAAK